jgi:hypothetical protein
MTLETIETGLVWLAWGLKFLAAATLGFGVFSALGPRRSIALYQWIMERFNWRVSPIDEPRELRTTRLLGGLLALLSLAVWWRLVTLGR